MVRVGPFHRGVAPKALQIRRLRYETDRAAHGARAVQSALRSAQHFDVIEIVEADIGLEAAAVVGVRAADHRFAVVDASGRIAGRVDTANDILFVARTQVLDGQAGNLARDIHDPRHTLALQS